MRWASRCVSCNCRHFNIFACQTLLHSLVALLLSVNVTCLKLKALACALRAGNDWKSWSSSVDCARFVWLAIYQVKRFLPSRKIKIQRFKTLDFYFIRKKAPAFLPYCSNLLLFVYFHCALLKFHPINSCSRCCFAKSSCAALEFHRKTCDLLFGKFRCLINWIWLIFLANNGLISNPLQAGDVVAKRSDGVARSNALLVLYGQCTS